MSCPAMMLGNPSLICLLGAQQRRAYNRAMLRLATAVALFISMASAARAQVRVTVSSSRVQPNGNVQATVHNDSDSPITVCVDWGAYLVYGPAHEADPFILETKSANGWRNARKVWNLFRNRTPAVIDADGFRTYRVAVSGRGQMRLTLYYWTDPQPANPCIEQDYPDGAHTVASPSLDLAPEPISYEVRRASRE